MKYEIFNEKSIVPYIRNHPELSAHFGNAHALTVDEIGDGNLNLVFIVRDSTNSKTSAILKQAPPYLRVAGDSWPLTRERVRFEAEALMLYNKLAQGLVPKVYAYDHEMSVLAMEFLDGYEVMRKPLVAGTQYPCFADHLSSFLASVLFKTSDFHLSGPQKKALQRSFINPELCKIQEDFVFTNPYMDSKENNNNPLIADDVERVRSNWALKKAIVELKELYASSAQALIHGDLHTGSIMLTQADTRVIDPEFAFFGPMGYDLGALISNLMMNYASHFAHTPDRDRRASYQTWIVETIEKLWTQFAVKFERLWLEQNTGELAPCKYWNGNGGSEAFSDYRKTFLLKLLRDTAGLGACESLRRTMGIVSVWDLSSIGDPNLRATAERFIIRVSSRWILERNSFESIRDLTRIIHDEISPLERA